MVNWTSNGVTCTPKEREPWNTIEVSTQLLGGKPGTIDREEMSACARRLKILVQRLHTAWAGLASPELGYLTDWLIAALIARENALLIGPPGGAKSQIATGLLELLGLERPQADPDTILNTDLAGDAQQLIHQLQQYDGKQKYFHYLISKFTQPEEIFGPIEIGLLRRGILARVNLGLMTARGVRAAFLDEIFKASSSILNTLLTLTNERKYFNLGGMVPSDLMFVLGASNEMPGGFATGSSGIGSGGEEFNTLYAFLDRFPVRIYLAPVQADNVSKPLETSLAQATMLAIRREADRFVTGDDFAAQARREEHAAHEFPVINDLLLLGRGMLQHLLKRDLQLKERTDLFDGSAYLHFEKIFHTVGGELQRSGTSIGTGRVTWTISPRKLNAIYKIALAHALIRQCDEVVNGNLITFAQEDLRAFKLIWDAQIEQPNLNNAVDRAVASIW